MSDFIFYGLTGKQAQRVKPLPREHFESNRNAAIGY